jgi:hypothetical protein
VKTEVARFYGFLAATAAVGAVAWVFGSRLLGAISGPENELITWVKKREQTLQGFDPLEATKVGYQRLSVSVADDGDHATVSGTLDFRGTLGSTEVSSLGFERLRFVRQDGAWVAVDGPAPRLGAIVRALGRRSHALAAGDIPVADGLDADEAEKYRRLTRRTFKAKAWFIRSERERVDVSEDYRLSGLLPERPVEEHATRRLVLQEDSKGEFFFPHGLL